MSASNPNRDPNGLPFVQTTSNSTCSPAESVGLLPMQALADAVKIRTAPRSRAAVWGRAGGCVVAITGLLLAGCGQQHQTAPTPTVVEVAEVAQQDVPVYQEWIGTLHGLVKAQVRAQVTGYLKSQHYKEGSFVNQGELLFEIDSRPFQATLNAARGRLGQAEAQLRKTELDVKRYTPLAASKAVSQEELDNAIQANLAAQADAVVAKAGVEQAQLNLDFAKITAPVAGIAGIADAQIGDLVGPSSDSLITVSTVNPIKAYISMSEQEYLNIALHNVPLEQIPLDLFLADGSLFSKSGKFSFTDRDVDARTGTIRVVALFENPGNVLRPGQFGRVRARMATKKGALLIPQRAVAQLQDSFQVAVVGPDNRVEIRPVKPAEHIGARVVINTGLRLGEHVVVEGIGKMKPGMLVTPHPFKDTTVTPKS